MLVSRLHMRLRCLNFTQTAQSTITSMTACVWFKLIRTKNTAHLVLCENKVKMRASRNNFICKQITQKKSHCALKGIVQQKFVRLEPTPVALKYSKIFTVSFKISFNGIFPNHIPYVSLSYSHFHLSFENTKIQSILHNKTLLFNWGILIQCSYKNLCLI